MVEHCRVSRFCEGKNSHFAMERRGDLSHRRPHGRGRSAGRNTAALRLPRLRLAPSIRVSTSSAFLWAEMEAAPGGSCSMCITGIRLRLERDGDPLAEPVAPQFLSRDGARMKGFLHRVAASVVRPQPGVRPFVESIYSAPRPQTPAEPLAQHEIWNSGVRAERVASQSIPPEPLSEASQSSLPPQALPALARIQTTETVREQGTFHAILPRHEEEVRTATGLAKADPQQPKTGAAFTLNPAAAQSFTSPQDQSSSPNAPEFVPIVVEHLTSDGVHDNAKPLPIRASAESQAVVAQAREQKQSAQIPAGSRPAQSQSDDIQIHIGRIEVIAVPPPAPRPAPAPARKGLSLDEYLSRRNGRAG
jgi:hypothetical protein